MIPSCPSALCVLDPFVFLVCLRAPPFRELFFSFLAVLFALYFALALASVLTRLALARLAFGFVVRARPSIRLIVLHVFRFISTISCHMAVRSTP